MKLTRARNWAFVVMLVAAVAAFGANAHVKAARAPEETHYDCPWDIMYGVYRCEQTVGDPESCPTTDEAADRKCNDACAQNSLPLAGINPGGAESCSLGLHGPEFPCICGYHGGGG